MSEQSQMLADTVTRLLRDTPMHEAAVNESISGEAGGVVSPAWHAGLWAQVVDLGLTLLLVSDERGGVGGDWEDALAVLQPLGYYAAPIPVGEAMLANRLLADAGLDLAEGVTTLAVQVEGSLQKRGDGYVFSGALIGVPWGRQAETVVTVVSIDGRPHVVALSREHASAITQAQNLAFEPRDDLRFDDTGVQAAAIDTREVRALFDYAALLRLAQITGALEAALHRSIDYAKERKQFGRAIGQFQAVQQQLALFGVEAAAVACAARSAFRAAAKGDAAFAIAAAKLRANMAIGVATATAHQVHAAIGFTWEYALRQSTQRLWSWRSEFGNDRYWADRIGSAVAARGADHFWSDLTSRDDAVAV